MEKKLDKIYVKTTTGIQEYLGGANFPLGEKRCPKCNSIMEFMPLKQEFIRTDRGKILVENVNGILMLCATEPITAWMCNKENCNFTVTTK